MALINGASSVDQVLATVQNGFLPVIRVSTALACAFVPSSEQSIPCRSHGCLLPYP